MKFQNIQSKKNYEIIADSIIEEIKNGKLKPGDQLDSIENLAVQFGVGSSVIRESLNGLRVMGVVEIKHGSGTYIKDLDYSKFLMPVATSFLMKITDVKELYEVRKFMESGSANLAAKHRTKEDLVLIEESLYKMENANSDEKKASEADLEFHMAIANATHNKLMIRLISSGTDLISETIKETRKVLLYSKKHPERLFAEHKKIFDAIKNGNAVIAEKSMYEHLERVNQDLFKGVNFKNKTIK